MALIFAIQTIGSSISSQMITDIVETATLATNQITNLIIGPSIMAAILCCDIDNI